MLWPSPGGRSFFLKKEPKKNVIALFKLSRSQSFHPVTILWFSWKI